MKLAAMDRIFTKLKLKKVPCKHHAKGILEVEGKKILTVYHSFGRKDIPGFVSAKIAKSMGLDLGEMTRMAKCKISEEEYLQLLRERGLL